MTAVRPAAVAGLFYPARRRDLAEAVHDLLAHARSAGAPQPPSPPKAIIAPHAGYVYSGPIAASAYARLAPLAERVSRVVLIGPAHRVPVQGLCVPQVEAFETPLGPVPLDHEAIAALLELPQVRVWDAPHAEEHALEVHLPFLQTVLRRFRVIPLLAGDAAPEVIATVLERVWGGPETLIVVSSDLSHYLDYATAQQLDAATCASIEALDAAALRWEQACGRVPVSGLLTLARRRGLAVATLDLRNSGDTAGDRRRVVGYGAWAFFEPPAAPQGDHGGAGMSGSDDGGR